MIKGELNFPGDKSISHRALMLAALCDGESRISNLSNGADVKSTRECLEACGIEIRDDGEDMIVKGGRFSDPGQPLNCGNSGTTTRLLLGLLAGQGINATLIGDKSLSSRPMNRALNPLIMMGLKTDSERNNLPITIHQSELTGIHYESPVASAQVKSAVLFAGLGASGKTSVSENVLTRDHTERMLQGLGVNISVKGLTTTVSKLSSPLPCFEITIPGDPSTAAFFAAAAALVPNSEIILNRILANPTRTGFFEALENMGAKMECLKQWDESGERIGNMKIFHRPLKSISISNNDVPGLIDEIPILAILATQAKGRTEVCGAKELRVKECDRIHAICSNLKRMGADIEELDDGFIINGPTPLNGAKIETFNDHRIAMAFTIAGLITDGEIILDNPDCACISYPEFYSVLEGLIQ
ncbi:MAG: 3-phosphoshikimate 1-carboxyvinyltransferase [Candidatus Marinimicrobia bacterium]|nr:3-phosphoshikimate 1-carboxyvinyltransferase [Candidatus Neomarinimicrobiota bacterium]